MSARHVGWKLAAHHPATGLLLLLAWPLLLFGGGRNDEPTGHVGHYPLRKHNWPMPHVFRASALWRDLRMGLLLSLPVLLLGGLLLGGLRLMYLFG